MAEGNDRRRAILDAALALVEKGGLPNLTIKGLAEVSGASNGSIYHHFSNRAGVIAALYRESFQSCIDELVTVLDDRPAVEVVPDIAARYLRWVATNPARARFIYAAAVGDSLGDPAGLLQFKEEVFAPVAAWISQRVTSKELRPVPLWSLDPVVMGPAHECARRFLAAPNDFPLTDATTLVRDATWAVLRPD